MNLDNCLCGRAHKTSNKLLEISVGAIEKLSQIIAPYSNIYVVADEDSFKAAGEAACAILDKSNKHYTKCILPAPALPTVENIGHILLDYYRVPPLFTFAQQQCFARPDLILAIGSGSINDMVRTLSIRLCLPYCILGTAPSMDGYSSNISPIIANGTKVTFRGKVPEYIIADIDIMKNAPYDMLLAGIGDMAGKYVAILDWEMARDLTGEYYCQNVADMVIDATGQCLDIADQLKNRDAKVVQKMVEGLVKSGFGMSYTGVSRPASGSEHMLAHTFEIHDLNQGKMPNLHGLEVAQGAMAMSMMYQKLYRDTQDERVRNLIEKYMPFFEKLPTVYKSCGMKWAVTDRIVFKECLENARLFRDRFTILHYLHSQGKLDEYIAYVLDNWEY